jgi:fructose-1,6-bisphosphatase/sedoheptulose 1,7-bisphosphatase-like protein
MHSCREVAVQRCKHCIGSLIGAWLCITTGEKDEAPMLYCGERIGCTSEPRTDIAVDPLDGTTLVSQGRNGAIAVIAVAERGALFDPGPCMYMEKVPAGHGLRDSWLHAAYS